MATLGLNPQDKEAVEAFRREDAGHVFRVGRVVGAAERAHVDALRLGQEARRVAFGAWFEPRAALVLGNDLVVAARAPRQVRGFEVFDVHLVSLAAAVQCNAGNTMQCKRTTMRSKAK